MENYKYSLAKKGKSICPVCKRKTYVLYVDASGEPLNSTVGKCDRSDNCGHHYTPKQYFKDDNFSFDNKKAYLPCTKIAPKPQPKLSYINPDIFKKSLRKYENNRLIQYLSRIVGVEAAREAAEKYNIGSTKNGGTIFWEVDLQGKIRTGKIIVYGNDGHRRKDVMPPVGWVHSLLKLTDFHLSQCLFGEHLLFRDLTKMVAIVESEKSAIIASIYLPQYIWLACGGSEGLNIEKFQCLKGRKAILLPDCGMYEKWSLKAKELSKICSVTVSSLIEKNATDEERKAGFDLADYLVRFSPSEFAEPQETPNADNETQTISQQKMDSTPYYAAFRRRDDWTAEISDIETWLEETTLPIKPFRLSAYETIDNCQLFVEALLLTAKSNAGNPTFRPYLDKIINLKNKLSV